MEEENKKTEERIEKDNEQQIEKVEEDTAKIEIENKSEENEIQDNQTESLKEEKNEKQSKAENKDEKKEELEDDSKNNEKENPEDNELEKVNKPNEKEIIEKKDNSKVEKRSKKKWILIFSCLFLVILIFSIIFAILNEWNEKIIKGVTVNNTDVSMCTRDELKDKLSSLINENNSKNIILKYQDNETTLTPESLDATYNIDEVVNNAYLIGRNSNIFVNNFEIVKTFLFKTNIQIEEQTNIDKVNEVIASLNQNLPGVVEEPDYYIDGNDLIVTKGKEGIKVNETELIAKINDAIKEYSNNNSVVEIPTEDVKPDAIDIEKIHNEIYKEAQDAYVSQNPTTVHPDVKGVDFKISIDEAKKILEEDKEEYTIPLKYTPANKTLSDLGAEAFPNQLGTFSTKYDVGNTNRSTNIKLATEKINGTIILPGETFSYNQILGKRTIESGYKEAGAYSNGQIVQEVGGGICQVSSTLYNAVLYANLDIVERYNHYFESSYVDAGRDATVSWGTVDFKFKNNRTYPIKIVATSKNGTETISIYGLKEATEYDVVIQSTVISKIERTTKYEDDDTLESGKEVISQTGHDGCVSETYKILRLNGETISKTLLSRDTYKALEKIIRRGTNVVENQQQEQEVITDTTSENIVDLNNTNN